MGATASVPSAVVGRNCEGLKTPGYLVPYSVAEKWTSIAIVKGTTQLRLAQVEFASIETYLCE
jgi:hypothetical protein